MRGARHRAHVRATLPRPPHPTPNEGGQIDDMDGIGHATTRQSKMVVRQRCGPCHVGDKPEIYGGVVQSKRVLAMRGMLPPGEARMRVCVMRIGDRGRWTWRDWIRSRLLWKFFPWYARELRYRGNFCIGASCMYWFWEDSDKKERGYCAAAVSRTQNMMWAQELKEHDE